MVHHHHGRRRQSRLFNLMLLNGELLLAESLSSVAGNMLKLRTFMIWFFLFFRFPGRYLL
jgi:hypothetical protein